jgi:hypothetical protein
MEGGRRAGRASDEDEKESAGRGIFKHADQYGQFNVDVQKLRPIEEGRKTGRVSNRDEKESIGRGIFRYADQHKQSCLHLEKAGPRYGNSQLNREICTAADANLKRRLFLYFVFLCSIDRLAD